MPDRCN